MNPPDFSGSTSSEDPENFIEELRKVFQVMRVTDGDRAELAAYQLKSVARLWYDQWSRGRLEAVPVITWGMFEEAFLGRFFPRELREAKMREFLNLKQGSMTVQEYGLKFTQLSRYAPEMVANERNRMGMYVEGLNKWPKKDGRGALLQNDMEMGRLVSYVEQSERDRQVGREEDEGNKRAKTVSHEQGRRGNGNGGRSSFQIGPAPSSASAPTPGARNDQRSHDYRPQSSQSQASVVVGSRGKPPCGKCGRMHLGECRGGGNGCFRCGQIGHVQRDCPTWGHRAQSSTAAPPPPPPRGNQRGETTGTSGTTNRLYAMGTRQEQENSPDVVTGTI